MSLLGVPVEVRLRIYFELLVQDSPVKFRADHGPGNPPLHKVDGNSLHPAILRVSKMFNREAIPLLYSHNRFLFPDVYTSILAYSEVPYVAPFFQRIGLNAGYLRHICISFPTPEFTPRARKPFLREEHINVLQNIRETCLGLQTLEMSCLPPDNTLPFYDVDETTDILLVVNDSGFKDMPSLEKVVVVCGEYNIDEEVMAFRDSLLQKLPSAIWSIELTKVPPRRWISCDDMVEFDNEEDCLRYNEERLRWEMEMEEKKKEEEWEEEYWRRRHDPYWKNDSDYD